MGGGQPGPQGPAGPQGPPGNPAPSPNTDDLSQSLLNQTTFLNNLSKAIINNSPISDTLANTTFANLLGSQITNPATNSRFVNQLITSGNFLNNLAGVLTSNNQYAQLLKGDPGNLTSDYSQLSQNLGPYSLVCTGGSCFLPQSNTTNQWEMLLSTNGNSLSLFNTQSIDAKDGSTTIVNAPAQFIVGPNDRFKDKTTNGNIFITNNSLPPGNAGQVINGMADGYVIQNGQYVEQPTRYNSAIVNDTTNAMGLTLIGNATNSNTKLRNVNIYDNLNLPTDNSLINFPVKSWSFGVTNGNLCMMQNGTSGAYSCITTNGGYIINGPMNSSYGNLLIQNTAWSGSTASNIAGIYNDTITQNALVIQGNYMSSTSGTTVSSGNIRNVQIADNLQIGLDVNGGKLKFGADGANQWSISQTNGNLCFLQGTTAALCLSTDGTKGNIKTNGYISAGSVNVSGDISAGDNLNAGNGINTKQGIWVNGTSVIDSSRNITNVGNLNVSTITASGNINGNGINSVTGYSVGGTRVIDGNRNIVNVGDLNFNGFMNSPQLWTNSNGAGAKTLWSVGDVNAGYNLNTGNGVNTKQGVWVNGFNVIDGNRNITSDGMLNVINKVWTGNDGNLFIGQRLWDHQRS